MAPKKSYIIALAGLLLLTAGCSGGRLRNLVGRSDYQSIEELESDDAAYDDPIKGDSVIASERSTARTVSQKRELDEESPSRFSISKLLRRNTPAADFGEDPFQDPDLMASPDEDRDVADRHKTKVPDAKQQTESRVAETTSKFSDTLSDVEKQSEQIFAELNSTKKTSANPFGEASETAEKTASTVTHSFSDFMAQRASRQNSETTTPEPAFEAPEVQQPAFASADSEEFQESDKSGFSFDDLVGSSATDQLDASAAGSTGSDLFPELDTMFADQKTEASSVLDPPEEDFGTQAFEDAIAKNSMSNAPEISEDPYSAASQKHGFGQLGKQDPWAGFESGDVGNEVSWAVGSESKATEDRFNWGHPPVSEYDEIIPANDSQALDSPFMQVASTTTSNDFETTTSSDTESLMIPFPTDETEPDSAFTIPAPLPPAEDSLDDDFFTGADDFELSEVPADGIDVTEESGSSGGLAIITGWPTRMWFFLLGCILVAVLLFLPNRQNQEN